MKMLTNRYFQILAVLLLVFCVAETVQAEYLLGADDVIQIKVYGYDDLATTARVSENGRIIFPLVGEVEVAGQTEFQVAHKIARLLAQGNFIQNANVSATIFEYKNQQISILGEIDAPGIYTLKNKTTLIDVIAMAGGINDQGGNRVIITRHINGKPVKQEVDLHSVLESSKLEPPVFIEKGDIIFVLKAPMFYIYGEVQHPGSFRIEPDMTVAQALSLGGGLTPRGTLNGLEIKRRDTNGIEQEIEVELSDKVLKDDVIVVDERWF